MRGLLARAEDEAGAASAGVLARAEEEARAANAGLLESTEEEAGAALASGKWCGRRRAEPREEACARKRGWRGGAPNKQRSEVTPAAAGTKRRARAGRMNELQREDRRPRAIWRRDRCHISAT